MISLKLSAAKGLFFDRIAVLNAVDKATAKSLSKAGAFIRQKARGLIRKVGKKGTPSKPGQPPKNRTGLLKDRIFFYYEPNTRSVVVGPEKTHQIFFDQDGMPVSGTVPSVLEYGGSITVEEALNPLTGRWARRDMRFRRMDNGGQATWKRRRRVIRIEARPYMGPAFEQTREKISQFWSGAVSR